MTDSGAPQVFHQQRMRREGEYWTLEFDGVTCCVRDGRGIRHLAFLVRNPHTEVPALFLVQNDHDGKTDTALSNAPPEADDSGDARERARVNVTRAIGTALRHIAAQHPALASHLSLAIKTGACCIYRPDPRMRIRWTE